MAFSTIHASINNRIAVIELDRQKRLNALNLTMMNEISDFLETPENKKEIRVLVITGKGDAFSAGADLTKVPENYAEAFDFFKTANDFFNFIENVPIPTIACINGMALGGGLELALCCDIRVAAESSVMGLPEINLGVMPGGGGTQRLPRVIGLGNAKELLLFGNPISAEEAFRMHLVNRVFPDADLREKTLEMAGELAQKEPLPVRLIKTAANKALGTELYTGISFETHLASGLLTTDEVKKGLEAFFNRK